MFGQLDKDSDLLPLDGILLSVLDLVLDLEITVYLG